jgi:CTP:molybdopterin cytidylyltransferase MocA
VLGSEAGRIRAALASWPELARLTLVENPRWEEGRSTSFEVGVAALAEREALAGLLVTAVDQPLEAAVLRALVSALDVPGARSALTTPALDEVLVPSHAGRRGHPIVLAPDAIARLAEASHYPRGLRDIVIASRVREVAVSSASIHRDLNTPEDLVR